MLAHVLTSPEFCKRLALLVFRALVRGSGKRGSLLITKDAKRLLNDFAHENAERSVVLGGGRSIVDGRIDPVSFGADPADVEDDTALGTHPMEPTEGRSAIDPEFGGSPIGRRRAGIVGDRTPVSLDVGEGPVDSGVVGVSNQGSTDGHTRRVHTECENMYVWLSLPWRRTRGPPVYLGVPGGQSLAQPLAGSPRPCRSVPARRSLGTCRSVAACRSPSMACWVTMKCSMASSARSSAG